MPAFDKYKKSIKKRAQQLSIASSDLSRALQFCNLLISRFTDINDPIYLPILTAVIVWYAKPFVHTKQTGSVSVKKLCYTTSENSLHNDLIYSRNKLFAHSGIETHKLKLYPLKKEEEDVYSISITTATHFKGSIFGLEALMSIKSLCEKAIDYIDAECKNYCGRIYFAYDKPQESIDL